MACSRLYPVMRKNKSIVDRYLLEMLFFCFKSLRIAEDDLEQIGTIKQLHKVIDNLQRLLKHNISILAIKRKDRLMFITLGDFLEWIFKQTLRPQDKCRSRSMDVLITICKMLQDNSSLNWLEDFKGSGALDDAINVIDANLCFSTQIKGREDVESVKDEIKSLTRSMHWCDWVLRTEIVTVIYLSGKVSSLFLSMKEFLRSLMSMSNPQIQEFLTPLEFEQYERSQCRAVLHFLSFAKELICKGLGIKDDELQPLKLNTVRDHGKEKLICKIIPVDASEFLKLLFLLILTPQDFGFRGTNFQSYELLSRLVMKLMKLLTLSSFAPKERLLECLRSLLETRPDLDAGNMNLIDERFDENATAGLSLASRSVHLENFKYLLKGYQQLLVAGILLPVLWTEKAHFVGEKLLNFVSTLNTSCSSTLEVLSSEILSIVVLLGIKVERLLEFVFNETLIPDTSVNNHTDSAGSIFYMRFRKVLVQKVKFFYRESLPLVLEKAIKNFTARLLLNALLDDYINSRTEENMITLKCFLNEFISQISRLAPCCRIEALYSDKLFFLEVLYKLLVLDSDGHILLLPTQPSFQFMLDSFLVLLGGAVNMKDKFDGNTANGNMNFVVQSSALGLVPYFASAACAHLFIDRISTALTNVVTNVLLVRETDIPSGSTHRATYLQTLDRLLAAVCSSKSPQLLEVLFPILQNCIPLAKERLLIALKQFINNIEDQRSYVCSMCLQILHDKSKIPSLKHAITEDILIPLVEVSPVDFVLAWYAQHMKDFFHAISRKPESHEHQSTEDEVDFLIFKSCIYKIISCLFMNFPAALIRDQITPLVSNQQLMQIATNDCRAKNDPTLYPFPDSVSLWRDMHVEAYNCLAAVVMCTQDQERIFTILFKDFAGKPLWQHLIDCDKIYDNFPVEISQLGSLKYVTSNLRSNRIFTKKLDGTPTLALSQYMMGATLSQEPSLVDSFVGGSLESRKADDHFDENSEDTGIANLSSAGMDLADQDDFDKHPCFRMVLKVISHLHSKFNVSDSQVMPEWMKALHSTLSNSGTPINICLFIIKVVIRARKVFAPFGSDWVCPVLQPFLNYPESSGGVKFHYILRDISIVILDWNLRSPPDKETASRFLNHLFQVAPHESNQVLRANLEIIQQFLARWKDCLVLDTGVIASHLLHGDKNPSVSDKAATMHKIVGLQILGAMISVGLDLTNDTKISQEDWIKALLSCLNSKAKGVYEASAELLGMLLGKQSGIHCEQLLETRLRQILLGLFREGEMGQFLTIVDKISLHCASFMEGYSSMIFDLLPRVHGVFRVLSLSIILRCSAALPNLFSLILPFLSKMLTHRDEVAQFKSLQLVAELVKDADKQIICEQILPILIESFSTHDTVECRKRYYEILVFLFVTRKIMTEETLTCNLLRGLCDNSYSIRENLQSFWNKQLSSNPRERFLEMISRIYSPAIEDHWVHIANSLLLKLCEEAVDYKRPIFNAPLSDCEFKEHTIDTSFLAGTFPMTPMFHDTQVAASQIQTQEQDVEHSVPSAKGPNMLRATISQTQTLEPSVGLNSFSTFSSGESESSLFALSQRKIKSLDSTQLSGSSQVKSVGISRRRLLHPSAARPQILRNVLSAMKRREARIAQQALERSNKVNVLRKYRIGELPDIEINHEEIIRPLAALSERDSTFSCLLLRVLCRAIYAISANQYLDNGLELKPSVIKAIESVFERTQNNISFVNCVLSLCLEDRESFIKPTLIGSVSMKSTNFQSGILYLENVILNSDLPWNHSGQSRKRHKNSRGHATMQPDALQQAWLELASLYRSLGENDIVLSIYKKHLTKATSTHNALEAELGGESVRALRLYDKAIDHFNGEEEDSVHPSDIEQDLWYVRRLYCLTRILNWRAVIDEILFQVEDCLDKLWEPKVRDSYLSLFVRAAIKVPTHHSKLSNFLQTSANESWKNALIMKEFSTQVTTLAVSNDEFDKARFFIHECYESFLKHWTQFHPLAANARHFQIIKLQMTTELSEFLENVTHYKFGDVLRMMLEWRNRWPSPTMDDAEAWDDVVQNRLLFFQKLQSVFNSHLQRQNEEEGIEFARWLDGERAHLYYTASKGLVKQGSFEAAKSYMNQFVALNRDKLDFASYKSIIKLRCLEADRASRTDLQKACDMLQQVLGYLEGSLQKHSQPSWQFGLKILEGCAYSQLGWLTLKMARSHLASAQSINNCLKHLGSAFVAYRNGLEEMSKEKSEISLRTIAKYSLKFAFFCDELLKSAENERCGLQFQELMHNGIQAINLPAASVYPNLIVEHVLKSVRFDYSMNAHHGIARVLAFVGKYRDTWKAFVSASEDVAAWLFIPWIPQMLSSLDKDDGENFVHILEDIARLYPQAIYFPYNVSKLDFGLIGSRRATSLESILRSPILETLVRSLEDLTFPEQRLRDGLSRLKTLLEGGFQEKARGYFQALFYDILDAESMAKENRSCGEYNLKFAREYSKLLLNAVGKEGTNLLSMNEREFVKATGAIMANLQKALKVLPSGNLSLSLFSKWMANFDSSKDIWFSRDDLGASKSFLSTIDMFGSYDNFEKPDPHSHPKVVSFDQTVVSLSSKQRPKLLKVRGSDELEYKFIVKGGEDLRLDQRIEQLFEIMNAILNRDPSCAKRKLCVRTYSVIPVSRQCGMLQYVENTRPLDEVLKDGLASILLSGGVTGKDASGEVTSKIRMKFHEWLEKRGGSQNITECYRNMYAKVQIPEMEEKMFLLTSELPWDTLRTALFKLTTSAESFIALRAQYQRSLAVISIFGYVAGVGDRHLGNILLDSKGGALIPIDFGYSFGWYWPSQERYGTHNECPAQ
ncbi:hypothetical protein KP509_1Z120700 [Ceratopteris richardii]|nr:hypothetical protein KP509_1Z120700 [Ceratopteris richardii]